MDSYKKLDLLANVFNAANRVNGLRSLTLNRDTELSVKPSNLYILNEIMKIIQDYSPPDQRNTLEQILTRSSMYSSTYKSLKQNFESGGNRIMTSGQLVRALEILMPVLNNKNKVLVDKMTKVYHILKT